MPVDRYTETSTAPSVVSPVRAEFRGRVLDVIGRSCHKHHFCCDKSFVATNVFVVTNTSFDKTVITKNYVGHDKRNFVMTKLLS